MRWPTVKLLTTLLFNKSRDLQEAILVSPQGVSKLMDLLSDSREIIRNDVSHICLNYLKMSVIFKCLYFLEYKPGLV